MNTVIGAVIHNDTLTIVVRRGETLSEPDQHTVDTPQDAAALLLAERYHYRHDDPLIYIEAGSVAGPVLDEIRRLDENCRDQIVHGTGPATTSAGAGVRFYNRRSELHYQFRQKVSEGRLFVPAVFNEQVGAFAEEERDGKIYFTSPLDVAESLGRFPVFAIAAVLAAIDAPPRNSTRPTLSEWDPLAEDRL